MSVRAPDMRARLIAAAEQLFLERGVDAVSLREINAAAGARNGSALQYHLRDRDGVIDAVLAKHAPEVEARRNALLDQIEADGGAGDLRALAGAYVRPLAAKLDDPDGGRGYLQLLADVSTRPVPHPSVVRPQGSTQRWRALVEPLLPPGAAALHRRFTALQFTHVELARRARSRPDGDHALFTSHLVDLVTGLLAAPVSEETARLAAERDRRRSRRRRPG